MAAHNLFFIESLGALYEAVQTRGIFTDSKYFVDCVPKYPAETIVAAYEKEKDNPSFDLPGFVKANFELPAEIISTYTSAQKSIDKHLQDLWEELKRTPGQSGGTLIPLPYEYIVPGGRFREIYYWDSYFTMLGLQVSKRIDLIEHMVDNFTYLINEVGFIPNGNRTYYLGRSQPPFFALMIQLLAEEKGPAVFTKYQPALEKEYQFWMNGGNELDENQLSCNHVVWVTGKILNRYWDSKETPRPEAYQEDLHIAAAAITTEKETCRNIRAAAASGWDFSSRWFKDNLEMASIQTTQLIPIDLNCLLLYMEQTLLHMYQLQQDDKKIISFNKKISNRIAALQELCWNEHRGCYFDFNFVDNKQEEHFNLATVFPLFFNMATTVQATRIAALLKDKFLHDGGLVTTLYKTGQQWDAPNGWAPLQWMAYKGLLNYGFKELAAVIKQHWTSNCEKVFKATGKMMEKYNVTDTTITAGGGEYPNQDGFGWTNGVYLKMKASKE